MRYDQKIARRCLSSELVQNSDGSINKTNKKHISKPQPLEQAPDSTIRSMSITYAVVEKQQFIQLIENAGPYIRKLFRPKVLNLSKKKLDIVVPFQGHHVGNFAVPCLHSGSVASMIDHVGSFLSWGLLDDGNLRVRTADLLVDNLAPPPLQDLRYIATIIHRSKSLIRTDVGCSGTSCSKRKYLLVEQRFISLIQP